MTPEIKADVYAAWTAGQSKASLAVEHDVSPRTIGRWIEEAKLNPTVLEPVTKLVKEKDEKYLDAYYYHTDCEYSKQKISNLYKISLSTVNRWLKKAEAELFSKDVKETSAIEEVVSNYRYTATSKMLSITKVDSDGKTTTFATDRTADRFEEYLDRLLESDFDQNVLGEVFVELQPTLVLEKFTQGKLQIDPKAREIFYVADEDTVPYRVDNSLSSRVIEMLREGQTGVDKLVNFMEKLMENPSRRAVNELYGFLEANDIVIAEDGDFYAWKKVRNNYLDIYTGTMDNSPGSNPRAARNMVDEDSNRTCSYGLHVCSKSYLGHFGSYSRGDRVVKVKVNPSDVVAIPADYNNAKMRCAGYHVIEDVTEVFNPSVLDE